MRVKELGKQYSSLSECVKCVGLQVVSVPDLGMEVVGPTFTSNLYYLLCVLVERKLLSMLLFEGTLL